MAVMRIWRTYIDAARASEYRHFANEVSLPMFRSHDGFVGVVFAEAGSERTVITFWTDRAAAAALDTSPRYCEAVRRIEETGFILGPSSVDLSDVAGGVLDKLLF
jgi:heme-degrading monooxygenase HmoA